MDILLRTSGRCEIIKIIFVVDDFSGGAGNIAQILATEYSKKKNEVIMILMNRHNEPRYSMDNIRVIDFKHDIIKSENLLVIIKNIRKVIISEKPNVIISFIHNNNALVGISLLGTRIPLIVSERGNPQKITPKFPWNILRKVAYNRAELVSVLFDNFKTFDNNSYENKAVVTPNPVMSPLYIKDGTESLHNHKKVRFVSFGRLAEIKRFDLMIEIFSSTHRKHPNSELYIYGEGPKKRDLITLINKLNLDSAVALKGSTKDVYKNLVEADIYLMTSKQEGFPNALCEAMAVGIPSVSFKCHNGLSEIVNNGENGFLIEDGYIEEFCSAIDLLISNKELYSRISEHSKEIVQKYNINEVLKLWDDYIKAAIQKAGETK